MLREVEARRNAALNSDPRRYFVASDEIVPRGTDRVSHGNARIAIDDAIDVQTCPVGKTVGASLSVTGRFVAAFQSWAAMGGAFGVHRQ